jgi:plasmid stabilization system protein ParE
MTFAVVYAKDAVDDIDAAFDWLAARVPAAAVDLLRAIGRAEIHLTAIQPFTKSFEVTRQATYVGSTFDLFDISSTFRSWLLRS